MSQRPRGDFFTGFGSTPQEAADDAIGQLNEWFTTQGIWHTMGGAPAHVFSSTLVHQDGSPRGAWTYILFIFGPPQDRPEPATGATVRLDQ